MSEAELWNRKYAEQCAVSEGLRVENDRLRLVLTMVVCSEQMEANGHDWRKCQSPSCAAARAELSHNDSSDAEAKK